jgi:hypothetical protein
MATTKEEIVLMKHRMDSVEDKLEKIDNKLDMLTNRLLNPDDGVAARVNKNTAARKGLSRALWVLYGIVAAALAKMFLE